MRGVVVREWLFEVLLPGLRRDQSQPKPLTTALPRARWRGGYSYNPRQLLLENASPASVLASPNEQMNGAEGAMVLEQQQYYNTTATLRDEMRCGLGTPKHRAWHAEHFARQSSSAFDT